MSPGNVAGRMRATVACVQGAHAMPNLSLSDCLTEGPVAQKGGSFCLQIRINGRLALDGLLAEKSAATGAGSEKSGPDPGPRTGPGFPKLRPRF